MNHGDLVLADFELRFVNAIQSGVLNGKSEAEALLHGLEIIQKTMEKIVEDEVFVKQED